MKFMRHARRTKLKVDDVDHALKVRNLEPLWGFSSSASAAAAQPFKKTVTASGTVYHVEEQEIDLSKVIKTEVPSVPRDISFTGKAPAPVGRLSARRPSSHRVVHAQHTGSRSKASSR